MTGFTGDRQGLQPNAPSNWVKQTFSVLMTQITASAPVHAAARCINSHDVDDGVAERDTRVVGLL